MNEVVVTPDTDISQMSDDEIQNYLKDASNWLILTDDYEKAQNNPNFKYDPVNVGTYNYSAYDFEYVDSNGNAKNTSSKKHQDYDVLPYRKDGSNWGNVRGLIFRNSKSDKQENLEEYGKNILVPNAGEDEVFNYWNGEINEE